MKNHWQLGGTLDLGIYPKNQELFFDLHSTDSEEQFLKNPRPGWKIDSLTYKFNSCGFRSREFDLTSSKPSIMTFGCSHTMGAGLPTEDTWSEQLGAFFPSHITYNVGLSSTSSDTVARLAVNMIPIIKPNIVAVFWPNMFRFETYENSVPTFHGVWSSDSTKKISAQFNDSTAYNNQTKNKLILDILKKIYGFTLISLDVEATLDKYNRISDSKEWDLARDGIHMGANWHKQVASDFYLQYCNLNDFMLKYSDPKAY